VKPPERNVLVCEERPMPANIIMENPGNNTKLFNEKLGTVLPGNS